MGLGHDIICVRWTNPELEKANKINVHGGAQQLGFTEETYETEGKSNERSRETGKYTMKN